MFTVYQNGLAEFTGAKMIWALRYIAKQFNRPISQVTVKEVIAAGYQIQLGRN